MQKHLGAPIQARKYWLDIDFPDGPPPEYERRGYDNAIDISKICETKISAGWKLLKTTLL